ncbi:MAG: alanine--tRNA ligase [Opitutaceae bacterium]|nr:alanine--tRNA ligase [Opitutaceae bacterium]
MTSDQIRQSFLDFFESKEHSIVPSASLMPDAPNLLFTNAGMNQFVPYFLGEREAPYPREADTQKCIRAGGKHNDLEDVGLDTYHHTFFEMLGNWSFGDYFKSEAIEWAWELITDVWKFPKDRLYATVYKPESGDPADFDQDAYDIWKAVFEKAGLDPDVHIVYGYKKDNFWMMGDTGPCGPCSELHIDLTPEGDTKGSLVNADSPYCIEIWNLVFIQFNATPGGEFVPLKSKHVDTGMGFERVAGIMATSKNFTDFSSPPSNYNSDLFTSIFDRLEILSGHAYQRTLPEDLENISELEMKDVTFRVLADHIRCLSCSIADGILPGNEGRNYVLRRILRRAVMYGRRLGLETGFFSNLAPIVIEKLGHVFPELEKQQEIIHKVILSEEESFGRTLDRGLRKFEQEVDRLSSDKQSKEALVIPGEEAFELYDTYGFPLDLTELLAKQRGMSVDISGFKSAMEAQRERARASQKKSDILVAEGESGNETRFIGYDTLADEAELIDIVPVDDGASYLVFNHTPFYAEMGGQVGDRGHIEFDERDFEVVDTVKDASGRFLHKVTGDASGLEGSTANLLVDSERRKNIERHHSATHILHWALREVLGSHVQQAGSYVDDERLRFDFSHFEAIKPEDLDIIESLCNERQLENTRCRWYESDFDKKPEDVIAFFGDKYGDRVRIVDIGGFSKELCGGTHVQATGEIGLLKIISESAIAAGTRRLEAIVGPKAYRMVHDMESTLTRLSEDLSSPEKEIVAKVEALLARNSELEKRIKVFEQKAVGNIADELASAAINMGELKVVKAVVSADNPNSLRQLGANLLGKIGEGVAILGAEINGKSSVVAFASPQAISEGHKAGDIIRSLTAKLDGKGGGKPDFAMGGGTNTSDLAEVIKTFEL